jgi:hypothetical protein
MKTTYFVFLYFCGEFVFLFFSNYNQFYLIIVILPPAFPDPYGTGARRPYRITVIFVICLPVPAWATK